MYIYIYIYIYMYVCMKVKMKVAQSCLTLCNPMDCVHGILQARILEWVAFPFSRGSSQPRDRTQVSHISGLFLTSWAISEDHIYIYIYIYVCDLMIWDICIYIYELILQLPIDRTPVSPSWLLSNTQGANCPKGGLCSVFTL